MTNDPGCYYHELPREIIFRPPSETKTVWDWDEEQKKWRERLVDPNATCSGCHKRRTGIMLKMSSGEWMPFCNPCTMSTTPGLPWKQYVPAKKEDLWLK